MIRTNIYFRKFFISFLLKDNDEKFEKIFNQSSFLDKHLTI